MHARFPELHRFPFPRHAAAAPPALSGFVRGSIGVHAAAAAALVVPHAWPWALGAVALDQAALTAAGLLPRCTLLGANLRRLPSTGRADVALTFDDGPDATVTPAVLDMLERHRCVATFFCTGAAARRHPALVRDIVRRGHAVENHTDRHLHAFACLPPHAMRREIVAAQQTLTALAGAPPMFVRPPAGLRSPLLQPILAQLGLRLASWTRRALDGVACRPAAAQARLLRGLAAGDVLLLHDRAPAGPVTAADPAVVLQVLPAVLQACAERGLRCVTLRAGAGARD